MNNVLNGRREKFTDIHLWVLCSREFLVLEEDLGFLEIFYRTLQRVTTFSVKLFCRTLLGEYFYHDFKHLQTIWQDIYKEANRCNCHFSPTISIFWPKLEDCKSVDSDLNVLLESCIFKNTQKSSTIMRLKQVPHESFQ